MAKKKKTTKGKTKKDAKGPIIKGTITIGKYTLKKI